MPRHGWEENKALIKGFPYSKQAVWRLLYQSHWPQVTINWEINKTTELYAKKSSMPVCMINRIIYWIYLVRTEHRPAHEDICMPSSSDSRPARPATSGPGPGPDCRTIQGPTTPAEAHTQDALFLKCQVLFVHYYYYYYYYKRCFLHY